MWKQIHELMAECVWLGMVHLNIPKNKVKQILVRHMLPAAMFKTGHKINVNCHHHPPLILCGNSLVILHSPKNVALMEVICFQRCIFFSTGATTHCGFVFCSPLVGLQPPRIRGFLITTTTHHSR